jgi:two-component system phosphate regulon sensor histidine kinase PhoR
MAPSERHNTKLDTLRIGQLIDDALFILNTEGMILQVNSAAVRLFGESLVGTVVTEVLDVPNFRDDFETVMNNDCAVECIAGTEGEGIRQFHARLRRIDPSSIALLLMDMTPQHNLEKVRRDFVANVSHELRSPLTSLIGFIETMQSTDELDHATRGRFLGIMEEEAGRMSRLINDLMSLSRVEVEEHIAPTDIVYIKSVINSVIASVSNRANKEGRSILFRDIRKNPDDATMILGETDEIMEVFHNLLDNAIKYGHDNTDVEVVISEESENELRFDVINIGDAIEEKHLGRLTERFYRVDKGRSRQMGGTGLGLAIVKHIVNRHRGRLSIASEPMDKTVFSITLPEYKKQDVI